MYTRKRYGHLAAAIARALWQDPASYSQLTYQGLVGLARDLTEGGMDRFLADATTALQKLPGASDWAIAQIDSKLAQDPQAISRRCVLLGAVPQDLAAGQPVDQRIARPDAEVWFAYLTPWPTGNFAVRQVAAHLYDKRVLEDELRAAQQAANNKLRAEMQYIAAQLRQIIDNSDHPNTSCAQVQLARATDLLNVPQAAQGSTIYAHALLYLYQTAHMLNVPLDLLLGKARRALL